MFIEDREVMNHFLYSSLYFFTSISTGLKMYKNYRIVFGHFDFECRTISVDLALNKFARHAGYNDFSSSPLCTFDIKIFCEGEKLSV